jgi:hypothetical protein
MGTPASRSDQKFRPPVVTPAANVMQTPYHRHPPETFPSKPGPMDPSFLTLNLDEKLKMVEGCAHIHKDGAEAILDDNQYQWNNELWHHKNILAALMQDKKPQTLYQFVFGKNQKIRKHMRYYFSKTTTRYPGNSLPS